jgi:hypothetical protein
MGYRRLSTLFAFSLFLVFVPALIAQNVITCSSNDMKRHFCDIGRRNDARLVNQRSGSPCVRGDTWGIQGNSIWVDRGCRADFEIIGGRGRGGDRRDFNRGGQTIRCNSGDMNYHRCGVNGRIDRAELARQISGSPCVQGRSWGYDRNSIWVNRGCRADFTVWLR